MAEVHHDVIFYINADDVHVDIPEDGDEGGVGDGNGVGVGGAVRDAVQTAVRAAIEGAVNAAINAAVKGAVNPAVRAAVDAAVRAAVDAAVRAAAVVGKNLGILLEHQRYGPLMRAVVYRVLGFNRDDQQDPDIRPGSLRVSLRCLTDKRFLEVLEDHKSGKMKKSLEEEFEHVGFKVEGLNIKIENIKEVQEAKTAIIKRRSDPTEQMTESEARTTKKTGMSSSGNQGFQLDTSKEHDNWASVNELLPSIQIPLSKYVDEIVQALHKKLREDLGQCSPKECNPQSKKKIQSKDLCKSCYSWFKKLAELHKGRDNLSWRINCKTAKWHDDPWEVAKFFMPPLWSNSSDVQNAESTDVSSLLNVLEWMKDGAFTGKTRIDVNVVRDLRNKVRNKSAHNPQQKIQDKKTKEDFTTAIEFIKELEKVWPGHAETKKCLEHLENLRDIGVTTVPKGIKTCVPDELENFIGREALIQSVISLLMHEKTPVVSLHGGPGFGKTAIAIEVSHKLSEDHNTTVVFSDLSTATSVDGMIRQLCRDVGVNYEDEDPILLLYSRLKHIKSKVIFVMDNIDNPLGDRSTFDKFVCDLRTNSKQCQIVTTSRTLFKIPNLTVEVKVGEMSNKESIELLKKKCPEQNDNFLLEIAEGCGNTPLAMCIAGDRVQDFDNPKEVLQHLKKKPMKFLEGYKTNQFVYKAINMSYEKCSDEEKKTLVRLAVFDGSFSKEAAEIVLEKNNLHTTNILKKLVCRSLIKQQLKPRYSFHLLIKQFLLEQKNSEDETAGRAKAQAIRAELLMVQYYLKLGHDLTMKSYSKDGYKQSREALKKEAHNIQNVLKICSQQEDPTNVDISDCLAESLIYTTSARHFSLFVRTITPSPIVDEFLQRCADMAEKKQQHANKMNFDCLLADQERKKSIGKFDTVYLDAKMKKIQEEFDANKEDFGKDKSLCAHYYYQCGRYLTRKYQDYEKDEDRLELQKQALGPLMKSLELRRKQLKPLKSTSFHTPLEIADMVYSLLEVGNTNKLIACNKAEDCNSHLLEEAKAYFKEAIKLSQEKLGEHELTAWCHKYLGDLFLTNKKFKEAEGEYNEVKKIRENLGLDVNERYVSVLNNLGRCLMNGQTNNAIEILESARDIAEKLAKSDEPNRCKTKVYASLAIAYDLTGENSEAVKNAKKALKFEKVLHPEYVTKMKEIKSKETK